MIANIFLLKTFFLAFHFAGKREYSELSDIMEVTITFYIYK